MQSPIESTRSYRVLNHAEQEEIMIGLRTGVSLRGIAKRLGRNVSSDISRDYGEQHRGRAVSSPLGERSVHAETEIESRPPTYSRYGYPGGNVEQKLQLGWSPEQIAGRLPIDHPGKRVSYETIYQFIFKTRRDLAKYLQCGRKHRRKRKDPRKKRVLIPERTGIDQRPAHINDRSEWGHWEGDTAIS